MKPCLSILLIVLSLLSLGCSTMNTQFSCNTTANDSCLTIEDVDALTRDANGN